MSQKQTKVSITKIQEILDFQKVLPIKIQFETNNKDEFVEITTKYSLNKDEKAKFILDVVNGCFIDNTYLPLYRDELFDIAILEYFTDIKVDTTEENLINMVTNSDIVEKIKLHINNKQLKSIAFSIKSLIDYKKDEILSEKENLLNETLGKLEAFTESCSGLNKLFESDTAREVLLASSKISKLNDSEVIGSIIDNLKDNKNKELSVY